ncbi:serine hydrolase domain-containing protein [Kineobactrum salinum]|uniref:Beta-lactamase family protein n=1 Tax=Kineobactrum salinum TaxID=2708301 RepID=A0A6C0U0X6_9GAMM|nr:serine hydrolase domain-containing protein [Kineobactrum salinum]QIB65443.1 beta-lactamase family protein [Kineobactrum salinum]
MTRHLEPAKVKSFVDKTLPRLMEANEIPGATLAITEGCREIVVAGHGFADIEQSVEVDSRKHLFRIASISKLFVWTSVMQLAEQGQLELDADINEYLDFSIPDTFNKPITLWHLLTHTPGFEDTNIGGSARTVEALPTLGEALKAFVPLRVAPPEKYTAYSNYGAALAGYIVERVSGQRFYEYVEENIFGPAGMNHSTFRQPVPDHLIVDMVKGYSREQDGYREGGFEFMKRYPDGAALSTAVDMARFSRAHLMGMSDSVWPGPDTLETMHSHQFSNIPQTAGVALGFIEGLYSGYRTIGHGGDIDYFSSKLYLVPSKNISVFIAFNSDSTGAAKAVFMQRFMDEFFPGSGERWGLQSGERVDDPADEVEGSYVSTRRNHSTIEKLVWPLMTGITIDSIDDRRISVDVAGEEYIYRRHQDGIYVPDDASSTANEELGALIVTVDAASGGRNLYFSRLATFHFEETPSREGLTLHIVLLLGALSLLIIGSFYPVIRLIKSFGGTRAGIAKHEGYVSERLLMYLVPLGAIVAFAFVFGLPQVLTQELIYGASITQRMFFYLPVLLIAILTAILIALFFYARIRSNYPLVIFSATFGALGISILSWQLYIWNMIGSGGIPEI